MNIDQDSAPCAAYAQLDDQGLLTAMFCGAIAACDPAVVVPQHLPSPPRGRTIVVGAGKAAAAMAKAVERAWDGPLSGVVVTRYGHGAQCEHIEVIEAAHPVPDSAGQAAAQKILAAVSGLTKDDLVICLMSGGASALLSIPAEGVSFADKQAINKALLRSGAPISDMNCVRSHLSAIKGGRLAQACGDATCVTLVISDVPGDDPAVIGSGPTILNDSKPEDALKILRNYQIPVPPAVAQFLQKKPHTQTTATVRRRFDRTKVIATNQDALTAAAKIAARAGVNPIILSSSLEGEAKEAAKFHASVARQIRQHSQPVGAPCVLLSGGEVTVTVRGNGRGGRNAEFLLALAIELDGMRGIHAMAGDTDGIDGSELNAGCLIAPDSLHRARDLGLDPGALLADNDGYRFFSSLLDVVVTGATRTNVNDFRAILIR